MSRVVITAYCAERLPAATAGPASASKVRRIPMARDPKMHDGESTPEELMEIQKGTDKESPTKEENEEIHKEFGDEDEPAA
jgi:hypothetical protein